MSFEDFGKYECLFQDKSDMELIHVKNFIRKYHHMIDEVNKIKRNKKELVKMIKYIAKNADPLSLSDSVKKLFGTKIEVYDEYDITHYYIIIKLPGTFGEQFKFHTLEHPLKEYPVIWFSELKKKILTQRYDEID